jgi:hypothetical protein
MGQNKKQIEIPSKNRYETKFSVQDLNRNEIENIIKSHPAIFHEIYFTRNVNNIYFDTTDFSSFIDNIEGVRDRKKVRIRWYGDLLGECNNPVLEIKYKQGLLGWKERHNLPDFTLDLENNFNFKVVFDKLVSNKSFDLYKLDLKFLIPTLLNRYERTYYLSSDKKYRLTLDNKMEFYSINPIRDFFKIFSDEEKTVVELKYNQQYADGARGITEHFPFRVTKNSKYVIGVDRIKNWK